MTSPLSIEQKKALERIRLWEEREGYARNDVLNLAGTRPITLRSLQKRGYIKGTFPDGAMAGTRDSIQWRTLKRGEVL